MDNAAAASQAEIAAALADGTAEEREHALAAIESVVRGAPPSGSGREQAVALAVASVKPLIVSVLCAPASKVGETEFVRASVLLCEMCKLDAWLVCGEINRKSSEGTPLLVSAWSAPDTVLAAMLAQEPSQWTRDSAIIAAATMAAWVPMWAAAGTSGGVDSLWAEVGWQGSMEWMGSFCPRCPFIDPTLQPVDRFAPLAILCLDLVRSEIDTQPEAIIAGAAQCLWAMTFGGRASVGKAVFEAGAPDVFASTMARYNALERISTTNLVSLAVLGGLFKEVAETAQAAGVDIVTPLLATGAVDVAISTLTAYQMLNKPEAVSALGIQWGALYFLEVMNLNSPQAQPVVAKLRSAGVDSFRYLLDHPLAFVADLGIETGVAATKIAALVWGRDDDGGGLTFKRDDIEKIVQIADHRASHSIYYPMREDHGQAILSLCISDLNKELLLDVTGVIPLLVDSLLLDPEHPRMENVTLQGKTDWEAAKGPVQRVSDSYLYDSCPVVQQLLAFY